jgi:hypothetical protein
MVRANREQVERFQETAPTKDFYAPMAARFKADPHRTDEPVLDYLRSLARPDETWLDIGGGAGRYALPLALVAREVTVIDPSEAMRTFLAEGQAEHGIDNVRAIPGRWPADRHDLSADTTFISHVGYDVEEIGAFLDGMEAAAKKRCIAVLLDRAPASVASPFWPAVHGEPRADLPGAREFITLLIARGNLPGIRLFERGTATYPGVVEAQNNLRMQLWIEPGSEKDRKLADEIARLAIADPAGIRFSRDATPIAVIEWTPRPSSS